MPAAPILDGAPTDSGGDPSSGSGSPDGGALSVNANLGLITASGYLLGLESILLIPGIDYRTGEFVIGTFDYKDFDSEEDAFWQFRQEIVFPGHSITVSRVRIIYRNIGKFTLTATITCAEKGNVQTQTKTFGTTPGDDKEYTDYYDLVITGERPQLSISRKANDGPVAISYMGMITDVEIAEQL